LLHEWTFEILNILFPT